ncbi:MAG: DNA alkylation repair protein [Ignavibacteriae bacterium]|nr:DNA alkylation repair protein [Ignavibacteriota bacterium]
MDIQKFYKEIKSFCGKNADPKIVIKYSRYFKEGYDAYGIDSKILDEQFNKWIISYRKDLTFDNAKKLGDILYSSGKYEESALAVRFFKEYKDEYKKKDIDIIKKWLDKYATNWAHTDVLSWEIIKIFLQGRVIKYTDLKDWIKSKSTWTRRAVPVSFIKILGEEKIQSLIDFIFPLVEDTERPVHQGIGWFLREAWKREPKTVEKFLLNIKDYAPRTIIQYATEKMSKEEKGKYKAKK